MKANSLFWICVTIGLMSFPGLKIFEYFGLPMTGVTWVIITGIASLFSFVLLYCQFKWDLDWYDLDAKNIFKYNAVSGRLDRDD